ncbi:MAG: hypothetical protein Q8P53_00605 [Candidatus Shapirobacteria bacterium]|nr:hypothetical protein [Candidatus Shapirobacteria bacterium]
MKSKKTILITTFIIALGLAVSINLVKKNQDTRRGAAFISDGKMWLAPETEIPGTVGGYVNVVIKVDPKNAKVTALSTYLCYDPANLSYAKGQGQAIITDPSFDTVLIPDSPIDYANKKCLDITLLNTNPSNSNVSTVFNAVTVQFKALKVSTGAIDLISEKTEVTGVNPDKLDKIITMASINGTSYKISEAAPVANNNPPASNPVAPTTTTVNGSLSFGREGFDSSDSIVVDDVGIEFGQNVWLKTNRNKVNSAKVTVCYGNNLSPRFYKFWLDPNFSRIEYARDVGNNCLELSVKSDLAEADLPVGDAIRLGIIYFMGTSMGSGNISFDQARSSAVGPNVIFNFTASKTQAYSIYDPANASFPFVNFKVTFGGVKTASSACAVNWPVKVIAMNNAGVTKTYDGVVVTKDGTSKGDLAVFKGSLRLADFPFTQNVSLFIKGPKHLQEKFGINNQSAFYDKYVGELTLTNDTASAAVDFSGVPISSGDVARAGAEAGQDGLINGNDFVYLKNKIGSTPDANAGDNMPGDLDGNCKLSFNDMNLFKVALSQRSDRLY